MRQAFRKEPNDGWEEECRHSNGLLWEEEKLARYIEAQREEDASLR
ncbi:hypothetical protein RvVAT039_41920 [Agrobacterium vitis]|nr:hypothetical protein RvVAT039_41920 [Agrobacterium vitis]